MGLGSNLHCVLKRLLDGASGRKNLVLRGAGKERDVLETSVSP